jgi:hypothetical protein
VTLDQKIDGASVVLLEIDAIKRTLEQGGGQGASTATQA